MNNADEKPKPQTFEDRTIGLAKNTIVEACRDIPELQQVAIIFDWTGELNYGAVPFILGDREGPLSAIELNNIHGMLAQTTKLVAYLSQLLGQSLQEHGNVCRQLEERIREAEAKTGQRTSPQQSEEAPAGEQTASPPAAAAED